MSFLLDTNVVSETRRKVPDANVLAWFGRANPADLFISVLTLGEIAKGIAAVGRRDANAGRGLTDWLDGLRLHFADRLLPIDATTAEQWGRLSAVRPLPVIDSLLAATASVHGLTLVTRNRRDFEGTGIAVVNPWEA
ncbi:MAG: type II toxin-antitoxin system VapC family toxin [Magnetospirillum sp.]|nr:type II toxin-antitoxin system VapC family toxin [Magnetospirillum sp.]